LADYLLYCFGESGNAYKAALMLELCRLDWELRPVDYFQGETRTPEYRSKVNELGEVPVLVHGPKTLSAIGSDSRLSRRTDAQVRRQER
jgi:glutathione S-transferase